MLNTLDPNKIYDAFDKHGFSVLRIDNFDRGDYAEIRAELSYREYLSVNQLQEITLKLNLIEKNENVDLRIVHIDMFHKTLRVNIHINGDEESTQTFDKLDKTEPIIQFYRTSNGSDREIEIVDEAELNESTDPLIVIGEPETDGADDKIKNEDATKPGTDLSPQTSQKDPLKKDQ